MTGTTTTTTTTNSSHNENDIDETKDEEKFSQQQQQPESNMAATETPVKNQKETMYERATSSALRPFIIISSSYLLFTITDGAIRMIVLMHAYNNQFTALEVSIMFTLYELAGVVTNLAAGILGAKWGIKFTLVTGLCLQLVSYSLLFGWNENWTKTTSIVYVTIAQMFGGIAKDLTKLGGKTVTKLVTPDEQETSLFKLVSLITGWKNSLKGVGYFLGTALIEVSYELALSVMMFLIVLALPWTICSLDKNLGMAAKKSATWSEIFCLDNTNLNYLSLARAFLFASRDFWFEVPLPFYLRSPQCSGLGVTPCDSNIENDSDVCGGGSICGIDSNVCESINVGGGCGGLGMERVVVGAFLGSYIILYGQIQSWTPQLFIGPLQQMPPNKYTEILWGFVNCIPTIIAAFVMQFANTFTIDDFHLLFNTIFLIVIIVMFAIIFAINSSIHSFLVVNYASKEKIAVSVGFYYMSNAAGRLFGTIGSGILYSYIGEEINNYSGRNGVQGMAACMFAGTVCSFIAAIITIWINDNKAGLKCGTCLTIIDEEDVQEEEEDPNQRNSGILELRYKFVDVTEQEH